jgi:hypothetical protein
VDRVLAAVREVMLRHGCEGEPEVLSPGGANVVVGFRTGPASGLVARCPIRTDLLPGQAHADPWRLREEVRLGSWLAARDAPVVPPADPASGDPLPAGPHAAGGLDLTVWRRARDPEPGEVGPVDLGRALRRFHAAAAGYPTAGLRPLAPAVADLDAVIDRLPTLGAPAEPVAALRREWHEVAGELAAASDASPGGQALHGDPHPGNALVLDGRLVWNDLEDCCSGPVGWDLGVLRSNRVLDGATAVRAYGHDPEDPALDRFARGRELQRLVWGAVRDLGPAPA